MHIKSKLLLGATLATLVAAPAFAQTAPSFSGTATGGVTTPTTTTQSTTAVTTGNSSVAPYQTFLTTTQNQTVTSTTTGDTASGSVSFAGTSQSYAITASGAGSQGQTSTTVLTETYNPGPPPVVVSSSLSPVTIAPVAGTTAVTSVSASGNTVSTNSSGFVYYGANLTTPTTTPVAGSNSVTAIENAVAMTTSGTTWATYTGTATYNPSTGAVTVALPATPQASTTVNSAGLTTTGAISAATITGTTVNAGVLNANVGGVAGAAGINAGGGRIVNLAAGTAATDAVNLGQLTSSITAVNSSISTLASLVDSNRKRSDAGTATAVALSGGTFLPGKKFNLTANVGAFRDEVAVSAQLGVLVTENVALNAGVSTSLHSYGGTAVRGGVTFGF